jgi:hypothetical protein
MHGPMMVVEDPEVFSETLEDGLVAIPLCRNCILQNLQEIGQENIARYSHLISCEVDDEEYHSMVYWSNIVLPNTLTDAEKLIGSFCMMSCLYEAPIEGVISSFIVGNETTH